jgi:hypothetical protein
MLRRFGKVMPGIEDFGQMKQVYLVTLSPAGEDKRDIVNDMLAVAYRSTNQISSSSLSPKQLVINVGIQRWLQAPLKGNERVWRQAPE